MEERRELNNKIVESLTRNETKLDNIHADVLELKEKVKIQNGRIGKLENWRSYVLGALAVTIFVVTIIVKH